jgi:hypothetical protein
MSNAAKRAIIVVSIRGGVVTEVRANHPLNVLVEDWDTEVRPSRDSIVAEQMLAGEEPDLTNLFQPTINQGEQPMTLNNQERAERCRKAIHVYSDDWIENNLIDFLADAMHLCRLSGRDFDDVLDTAVRHFETEIHSAVIKRS